jgi:hypothetical protein
MTDSAGANIMSKLKIKVLLADLVHNCKGKTTGFYLT